MRTQYINKKIESISFSIFSPKMIKQMASAKIVTPELYDKEGYPVDGGLMDTRLGVIDPGLKCKTCGSKLKECIGHFGYIELARPIIHYNFVTLILTLLRCTCRDCGRVLIPKNKKDKFLEELNKVEEEYGVEERRRQVKEIITKLKMANKCPYCKTRQYKISLEKPTNFFENEKRISPIEIRTRLERIPDEDLPIFGMNPANIRPEWTVLTVLPIPPVTMRPSITLESGERSEDDLTHKLTDIVRINQRLFENINAGAPEIIIEDLWDLLQYHITTFFDNSIPQLPPARHRSGQPLKTLTERIKTKEGRIRHNLAGKRTNFSARAVISPDPRLKINEIGVPKSVAMNLTVPERLTEWNIEYFKSFVERGPHNYPGANDVIRPDGKRKKITDETKEQLLEELQPGYIVERHLMDGDIALFNRQPSLHRMSMMCHKVKVLPALTFRLNPLVCRPYNADFDGDEMNLHIPQTEEAQAEAETLMDVQTQLISPAFGLSIIGCDQDGISGMYMLTKNLSFSRQQAIDLLMSAGVRDFSKLPKKDIVSGKEIFSVILPDDFFYSDYSKSCVGHQDCQNCSHFKNQKCDLDAKVVIEKGKLVAGVLDSANLGAGAGLLLRNIHKQYGQAFTVDFLSKVFKLGAETLQRYGLTVSTSDTDISSEAEAKIAKLIDQAYQDVDALIEQYNNKTLEAFPGKTLEETLELKILERLNRARDEAGKTVASDVNKESPTMIMAKSGARGRTLNVTQIAACVGQQSMHGGRIEKGYTDRTLSCFKKHDLRPSARGFIKDGFKKGLEPHELFFQAMTSRDSLMDTALRTPKSGYMYRKLANSMQDLRVEYDLSVRDASKRIIQFKYGDDSIDVSKSRGGVLDVKRIVKEVIGE